MKVNENLRKAIFETIENQIKADDPAETAGYGEEKPTEKSGNQETERLSLYQT